ncbi:MAG: FtsQ-type POTRA domain-containing protein [Pseudomonadota bacterium]|nr:FtsQ-type POTRA domain-containing protein [Pseudomonadota bacterium]
MARIKRSETKGVRRAAKTQSRAAGARKAKAKTSGFLDGVMGLIPLSEEQWGKVFSLGIIAFALGVVAVIANAAGVPALARAEMARLASDAGFDVRAVRVTGTQRMDESEVYALALGEQNRSMPQVDIEELRAKIIELSWVKDARVSLQLPDTLVIDIVEREPHAALQQPDHLVLIDIEGERLAPVSRDGVGELLLLSGPGADKQVKELDALLAASPALEAQIEGAEWIGNRRWNLRFASGQVLALPEGRQRATKALVDFANLDGQNRLIGGKVATFDMRDPPRIYMLEPGRAERIELAAGGS